MIFTVGIYEVTLNPISCTCADYKYRQQSNNGLCKHLKQVIDNEIKKRNL